MAEESQGTDGEGQDEVLIRTADERDVPTLITLGARTFEDTYGHANEPATLAAHIAASYNGDVISAALRDPHVTYVVADAEGEIVGFAKLVVGSREQGIDAGRPAELNQLYVSSDRHGRGLGRRLLEACATRAADAGCDVLWLGVWEKNPDAIGFYERVGFRRSGIHDFVLGSDVQTDVLMARPLTTGRQDGA